MYRLQRKNLNGINLRRIVPIRWPCRIYKWFPNIQEELAGNYQLGDDL